MVFAKVLASTVNDINAGLDEVLQGEMQDIQDLVPWFVNQPISSATFMEFEQALQKILRETGQRVMEFTSNESEPRSAHEGMPRPPLCYVTDAGDIKCQHYCKVLSRMRSPKDNSRYLKSHRIVNYHHPTQRITILPEAIFGCRHEASHWPRTMPQLLLTPSGVNRVLHAAAATQTPRGAPRDSEHALDLAPNYIRLRPRHRRYAQFKTRQLPLGSGVAQAACKTVFTQRLNLSGMGWTYQGARPIVQLRPVLPSGIGHNVYHSAVINHTPLFLRPYGHQPMIAAPTGRVT